MPDGLGGQATVSSGQAGLFRGTSLRNIGKTAPYGHNGFFATLQDIVNFYNSRDVPGAGWAPPEVAVNVNTGELGNLGLNRDEVNAIVAFMMTLSDNTEAESALNRSLENPQPPVSANFFFQRCRTPTDSGTHLFLKASLKQDP